MIGQPANAVHIEPVKYTVAFAVNIEYMASMRYPAKEIEYHA